MTFHDDGDGGGRDDDDDGDDDDDDVVVVVVVVRCCFAKLNLTPVFVGLGVVVVLTFVDVEEMFCPS